MITSWMPAPVGTIMAIVFTLIVVVHLGHAVVLCGRHRWWHVGHIVMGSGMLVMVWPSPTMPVAPAAGAAFFAAAAGLAVILLGAARLRGVRLGPLWSLSVLDLAVMGYMFMMMSLDLVWVSVAAALWFGVQALGWATGRLGRVLEHHGLGETAPATHPVATAGATAAAAVLPAGDKSTHVGARSTAARGDPCASHGDAAAGGEPGRVRVVDGGPADWAVRVTLSVMGAGMAYMLLAMQFGTASAVAPGMPGM